MNILDSEEMLQAEQILLNLEPHKPYTFIAPEQSLLPALQGFTSQLFPSPPHHIELQSHRFISNSHNLRSIKKEDPNACLKVFTYSLFALAFPNNTESKTSKQHISNNSLLETLKCSLFSRDFNFNQASNFRLKVENYQAKAMLARFLTGILARQQWTNNEKMSYIEWCLQKNGVLFELFILFNRIILSKLSVEGADDCNHPLNFREAITNLMEYFDINYRAVGEAFIISEQKFFLASVNSYIVMGQYIENNEQIKEEEGTKMAQMSKPPNLFDKQQSKSRGVLQNDMRMFNFMLQSGGESYGLNDKDDYTETPHFKDSCEFAFGKRRKESIQAIRQEEIRKQFEQFFINSSIESFQTKPRERASSADYGLPLLQEIASKQQFQKCGESGQTQKQQHRMSILDQTQSLIDELEDGYQQHLNMNPQIPHINFNLPKENRTFPMLCQQSFKLQQQTNYDSMNQKTCLQCRCFQNKKNKNKIISKVVQYNSKEPKSFRAPKFLQNLKTSQNINIPKINLHPKEPQQFRYHTKSQYIHKPLQKPEKKEPKYEKTVIQSKSKSRVKSKLSMQEDFLSPQHKKTFHELDRQTIERINNRCTTYSTIISNHPLDFKTNDMFNKSIPSQASSPQRHPSISVKEQLNMKNFDSRYPNYRPGLGNSWKYPNTPNFHNQNKGKIGNEKVQVYAPVHIIAPTVYYNNHNDPNNRVIFTVNEGVKQKRKQRNSNQVMKLTQPTGLYPSRHERIMSGHQHPYI